MNQKHIRKYPRISVSIPVEYSVDNKTFRERATTLGGGGLFLNLHHPPPAGTEIILRFRPAKHLPVIEAAGQVRYQVPGKGAALEFVRISPEHRRLLLRLIHNKSRDKRKHPRATLAAQIQCDECTSLALARDVSIGGMFIETREPLAIGARVNLRFNLDDNDPIVVVVAEVTYEVVKLGMGVQFIDIAPHDQKRIEAYVVRSQAKADAAPSAAQM